ncbi:phosphonoacetaldehyde hydrolase [Pseudomonas sp. 10B1]|uniref:phosphonoacetaldehyde hydrolase n=1 Tax=unclassified Pseudomonas TaxID=196821 RepID=UPI002AB38687|nr:MULTISPECIES: phosphonoacetaldehyde hydrolase [unclassified Pseudomonas]MDY7560691.1 phosphonoacetaldehyde hydrolase [Pseudomonas sp. AB6]MEA9976920.1 phosphonoacetaldehyde hydrolase [Pseudomonas sp. RTS4]MEA9996071.1 phosphonoacetaldehyde hydrolase [Pseudomonas sp. AA4]MEB0087394.1 phosphonoacetaldehyde hydrolase [Pseudomonas sp. RTI1]MEB0127966.1 phosphonoacetaldehyde hydrolase [Pseudomonas sp. CCC1.2]
MHYQQPLRLQAAILDWAGTVIDFGSFAPTKIFVEAFATFDIELSLEEARGPMGMGKWEHIRSLCDQPAIAERFAQRFGHVPTDTDVTAIYELFMPLQIANVGKHSAIIPGALQAIDQLRQAGLKIGTTSGYPKQVMNHVVALAAVAGYRPDYVVAADELPTGRPGPAQALANVIALGVSDVAACVKVDDTLPGILEGRSAGMWTVGLRFSGNFLGLDYPSYQTLTHAQREDHQARIDALFAPARAHYLIDTIADLPAVIEQINARLASGETPSGQCLQTFAPTLPKNLQE